MEQKNEKKSCCAGCACAPGACACGKGEMWMWTKLHLCPLHLPIRMQLLKTRRIQLWQRVSGPRCQSDRSRSHGNHDLA